MPSRLIASASESWNLQSGEKVQANIFEAYVAALYMSYLGPLSDPRPPPTTPTRTSFPQSPINGRSSSQSPTTPNGFTFPAVPSSQTADAEGLAFARIGYWLKPLFAPLCHWVLEEVTLEQKRLEAVQAGNNEDSHMDMLAVGATGRLNEHMSKFHRTTPVYPASRAGADNWLVSCTAQDKDGRI